MDYLHINAIIRETYSDAQCGCVFPEVYKNNLHEHVAGDDFLKNTVIDNVMTYFCIKKQGHAPLLVLAKVERQKTCESVGRAVQCVGWEWDDKLISSNMNTLFDTDFYTEKEYVEMMEHGTTIPLPSRKREKVGDCGIKMSSKVKKAIMTAVFLRWTRHDNPIRIAVPNGVDYNSYVWQAVEKIYALFPVALRLEAGFCSYMPDVNRASGRVYLGFIPEEMADAKTIFLDGSRQSAVSAMEKGTQRKNLDQFIDFTCSIGDDKREDFLQEVYEDLEGAGDIQKLLAVNPKDYQTFGEAAGLLVLQGDLEQCLPLWKAFYQNQDKQTPRMRSRVIERIHQMINPEEFCRLLCETCADKMDLNSILAAVGSYRQFYADNGALAEKAWNTMLSLVQKAGASDGEIYSGVLSNRAKLDSLVTAERLDDLYRFSVLEDLAVLREQKAVTSEEIDLLLAKTEKLIETISAATQTVHAEYLLAQVTEYQNELKDKQNELAWQRMRRKYEDLQTQPTEKMTQIQAMIHRGKELLAEIAQEPNTQKFSELKQEILNYIALQEEKINSSATKYAHIQGIIRSGAKYFAILEDLESTDWRAMESEQLDAMSEELESVRPTSLESYQKQFEDYYSNPLTLQNVSKLGSFVCRTVVQDICAFTILYVAYSDEDDAVGNLEKVAGKEYASKCTSDTHAVRVRFQNTERDSEWFRQMLKLRHNSQTMGSKEVFESVFYALVDNRAYNGAELQKCIQMLDECGLKFNELFKRMIAGKFTDCTEEQYLCAFEMIVAFSDGKREKILQGMQRIRKETDNRDKVADNAFSKFQKKNKKEPAWKRPKVLLSALFGVGAVALALLVLLIIVLKPEVKNEIVIPGTPVTPQETVSSEVVYLEQHELLERDGEAADLLFGAASEPDFSAYANQVTDYLSNLGEEQAKQIMDAYLAGGKPQTIDDDNTQVEWNEFFFWVCWNHANAIEVDPAAEFNVETYRKETCAILRVIYQTIPQVPDEDPNTGVTMPSEPETTEPATQPQLGTEPPNTNLAVKVTLKNNYDPENPPTIDELIETLCTAAKDNYTAADENAYELKLIMALFGPDYNKEFAEHRKVVEELLTAGDNRAAAQLERYHGLPGNTEITFAVKNISVTWNEYMFWECWVLATFDAELDAEEVSLNDRVLDVLQLIHELPGVNPDLMEKIVQSEKETLPVETAPTETTAPTEPEPTEPEPTEPEPTEPEPTEPDALEEIGFSSAANMAEVYYKDALRTYQAFICGMSLN